MTICISVLEDIDNDTMVIRRMTLDEKCVVLKTELLNALGEWIYKSGLDDLVDVKLERDIDELRWDNEA